MVVRNERVQVEQEARENLKAAYERFMDESSGLSGTPKSVEKSLDAADKSVCATSSGKELIRAIFGKDAIES